MTGYETTLWRKQLAAAHREIAKWREAAIGLHADAAIHGEIERLMRERDEAVKKAMWHEAAGDEDQRNSLQLMKKNAALRDKLAAAEEALAACQAQAGGRIETLEELLRECEWHQQGCNFAPSCPWCGQYESEGHSETCSIDAALNPEPCGACGGSGEIGNYHALKGMKPCPKCHPEPAEPEETP